MDVPPLSFALPLLVLLFALLYFLMYFLHKPEVARIQGGPEDVVLTLVEGPVADADRARAAVA